MHVHTLSGKYLILKEKIKKEKIDFNQDACWVLGSEIFELKNGSCQS
jgi:hypothetical protein